MLAPFTIPVTTGYVYGTRVNISVYVGRGGTCAGTKVHIDYPVQEVLWWSAGIANMCMCVSISFFDGDH